MRLRGRNARRPFRIIRQEQQSFACFVQPPDRRNPGQALGQIRVRSLPVFFVCCSRYNSARFVKSKINLGTAFHWLAIYFDPIFSDVHRRFRIMGQRSVQLYSSRGNQLCCARSRAIAEF